MYKFTEQMQNCYSALQDRLSKDIFWARLQCDFEPDMTNVMRLTSMSSGLSPEKKQIVLNWKKTLDALLPEDNLILYGTGDKGQKIARFLFADNVHFYGFCSRSWKRFPNGLMHKPVLSPEQLFAGKGRWHVIIAGEFYNYIEIRDNLLKNHFPFEHIVTVFDELHEDTMPVIYFEFPELVPKGKAMIDGGSFDGADSLSFARVCKGDYSHIFAIEPDPSNCKKCAENLACAGLHDTETIQAGLSDQSGSLQFVAKSAASSFVVGKMNAQEYDPDKVQEIRTVCIDDLAHGHRVGMIKMDIEGAELDALQGAEELIVRCKPKLAICIYHKFSDLWKIPLYIKSIVPEYKIYIRHHTPLYLETVCYAIP